MSDLRRSIVIGIFVGFLYFLVTLGIEWNFFCKEFWEPLCGLGFFLWTNLHGFWLLRGIQILFPNLSGFWMEIILMPLLSNLLLGALFGWIFSRLELTSRRDRAFRIVLCLIAFSCALFFITRSAFRGNDSPSNIGASIAILFV